MTASATAPTSSVAQWMSPRPRIHEASSCQALAPSADVPVSFGSSPMTTSIAAPARNPVTTAFERKRAIQPSRSAATSRNSAPVTSAIAATSCAASFAAKACEQDRPTGDSRERRAGTRRDVPRRAEEGVDDRAGGGRVQAVLHRNPGDARVAEVLGHDHRRDRDPGDDVATKPSPVVRSRPVEDGQHARQAAVGCSLAPAVMAAGQESAKGESLDGSPSSTSFRRIITNEVCRTRSPATIGRSRLRVADGPFRLE